MENSGGKNYVSLIVYLVLAFGSFVGGTTFAYFGWAGLTYGQAVFEVDVKGDKYTYNCNFKFNTTPLEYNVSATTGECLEYNTSSPLSVSTSYETGRDEMNNNTILFLRGFAVIFALLTLVFLMMALKESGLTSRKKDEKVQY